MKGKWTADTTMQVNILSILSGKGNKTKGNRMLPHFQQYFSYIKATSLSGGRSRNIRR
jgi:ADP-ribosylglycohydrolase